MQKVNISIKSANYGGYNYSGQEEIYLVENEDKSNIQILSLILNHLIFNKLKINSNFYDSLENKSELIKEIYNQIRTENYFEISYWNPVNWSEKTIIIEKI